MRLSKVVGSLGVASVILVVGMAGCGKPARAPGNPVAVAREALFTNGDFESTAIGAVPSGWTVEHYFDPGITDTFNVPPNATSVPQTLASLNLRGTGSEANGTNGILGTLIVGGATEAQTDPDPLMVASGSLRYPRYGARAARLNYNPTGSPATAGALNNVNALRQTMTVANGDVDAADNKVHIRFAIAPVLQNPNHAYTQQPYYFVRLQNITKNTALYSDFNTSAQPGVPWKFVGTVAAGNAIFYTDWQLVDIAPGNAMLAVGDQVELLVIASGCAAGGHWGRVYVDGIGSTVPGIYTSATGPASANSGSDITYVVSYKNGGTATAAATQLNMVIPTGTTYKSNTLPSACSGVAVGATGTLTCALGALAAGSSGSFSVTVTITGASGTTITNGNYSIQATGVTALLGPKVLTSVTSGVTYADVAVTKTDGVAAVGWGQAVTYTVVASNAGPGAANSVLVADTMPAQFSGATWTCTGAGGGTCGVATGAGNLSGTVSLPVGATATYTISGAIVAGTGTGSITNNATATLSGATDPDTTNNSGVDTDSIGVLRTLTVTKTNANGGSVTSVPASIACGTSCSSASGSFVDGTSVVLSASPVSGASFTSWGGACSGSASTCTLIITSDVSVTAAFTPPPTVNLITGDNQGAALNTVFATTLTVRVLDSAGTPLGGRTVLFTVPSTGASANLSATSVTTDASGNTPAITATANGTAGAYSVVAALSGTPTTGTFSLWNYGAASTISVVTGTPQSAPVATAFATPLTVIVRDAASQPVAGATVTFTAPTSGALATLSAGPFTTGASGQVGATATAGQTAGSYSVTATTGALTPATFALTNAAGAAASIAATSGGGQTTFVSTAFGSPLVVTVLDRLGNPVPGAAVTFTVPGSDASAVLGTASGTTNASGQLSTTATANGSTGAYSVSAAVPGVSALVSFSLGNYGTLVLSPATVTVAPRASLTFVASGDVPGTYVYSLLTNGSGGNINGATGVYTAGATGSVSDVVRVVDSHSRTVTATVTVGPGVSVTPASTTSAPRGSRIFVATGGNGTFAFSLLTNPSGGNINSATGAYTAGATGSVTDVVTVTDSLGNSATASVVVGVGVGLNPVISSVAPRGTQTFTASGGSGTFTYAVFTNASGGSIDGSGVYTAGATGGVTDIVTATDSLGNSAAATVSVTDGITLSPSTASTTPQGTVNFTASGGSGQGYVYASTAASGGAIDASGKFIAGTTGNVSETVTVQDSLGNSATAAVTVGPGVSVTPSSATVAPRGTRTFTAAGGSGTGFTYALSTNASTGTIIAATGAYTAGATGSVTDVITATDSLGNTGTASIAVGAGIQLSPAATSTPPQGTIAFTATGGSGSGYAYAVTTNHSSATVDATGSYVAGVNGNVNDTVTVTDTLGNTATASITVGPAVSLTASATSTPPRGTLAFSAIGGSGTPFVYSLGASASGGSINPTTGAYTAGSTPSVTDTVLVADSLGNVAAVNIAVGPGVSISPASPAAPPRSQLNLVASGGSGPGYVYTIVSSGSSGGSVDMTSGLYTAGGLGSTVDVVRATDSLGNSATVAISVGNGLVVNPAAPSLAPRQSQLFSALGGDSAAGVSFAITTNTSGGAINATTGAYVAGPLGSTTDVVTVSDMLGNTATATVQIGPGLVIAPPALTLAPLGTQTFAVSGGSGSNYRFSLPATPSGGTIDPGSGAYTCGTIGGVTDIVQVTDSFGNVASVPVTVTQGLLAVSSTLSISPLGSSTLAVMGGSGGYTFALTTNGSGSTLDASAGAYVAGSSGNTSDLVTVTDSNGATTTIRVNVGAGVSLAPATPSAPPRGLLRFTASGGSEGGYVYSLSSNPSGGTIDAATGAYQAGALSNTLDVVRVVDSLGNVATVSVSIGGGLAINPAMPSAAPQATVTFAAAGGSGTGFVFSLSHNLSGGAIVASTGVYRAGSTPNVTDEVTVTDSLGSSVATTVTVGAGVLIAPASSQAAPGATVALTASGGSGAGYVFALTRHPSGGTVDSATGVYVAGTTPSVSDTVTVTDSLQNSATATIVVGAGISLSAPSLQTPPRGSLRLTAGGGSGTYAFALRSNGSHATIGSTTGLYTAGATPNTTDQIEVTDGLGNSAALQITVGDGVSIAPASPVAAPGGGVTFSAMGGSGIGFLFTLTTSGSGGTVDSQSGAYVTGDTDDTEDVVTVVDSLGNTASVSVAIGNHVSLNPPTVTVSPGAVVQFSPSGGSGTGYQFTLVTNSSGATVDATSGAYQAGATANVTDVVRVVDSLGKSATATVTVGAGLSVTPATATVAPSGMLALAVSGGSGSGLRFTLSTNGSGGTVDPGLGNYTAGSTGSTTDIITVTDSLGNTGTVTITVGGVLSVAMPAGGILPPRATLQLVVMGGAVPYAFAVSTNHSGSTINGATGEFIAGPTSDVADVVTVTDANAVSKTVTINVGAGISIAPTNSRVAPAGTLQLSASGGSGTGFTWRLVDTSAGGSIDATTGLYTASHTPGAGTSDVAEARDSLGNTARTTVQIQASTGSTVSASGGSGCSCDTGSSDPTGHLPAALIGLLLAAMTVARRRGSRSP